MQGGLRYLFLIALATLYISLCCVCQATQTPTDCSCVLLYWEESTTMAVLRLTVSHCKWTSSLYSVHVTIPLGKAIFVHIYNVHVHCIYLYIYTCMYIVHSYAYTCMFTIHDMDMCMDMCMCNTIQLEHCVQSTCIYVCNIIYIVHVTVCVHVHACT